VSACLEREHLYLTNDVGPLAVKLATTFRDFFTPRAADMRANAKKNLLSAGAWMRLSDPTRLKERLADLGAALSKGLIDNREYDQALVRGYLAQLAGEDAPGLAADLLPLLPDGAPSDPERDKAIATGLKARLTGSSGDGQSTGYVLAGRANEAL